MPVKTVTDAAQATKPSSHQPASIQQGKIPPVGQAPPTQPTGPAMEKGDPANARDTYYLNRELTWLNFNRRVLHEAEDPRTNLLERVKFIAIVCSNLDEFFMKRIGGLKQQVGARLHGLSLDGRTPLQQIAECHAVIKDIEAQKVRCFRTVMEALAKEDIHIHHYADLDEGDKASLRKRYYDNIFPLVTPQGIDPAHPFPFISNLSLNLLVGVRQAGQEEVSLARVKVPVGPEVPRFLRIGDSHRFVSIEEVMSHNLDLLFPKTEILFAHYFRVTRNAVTEIDEDQADDLLEMIETELRYRKFAAVVRLQVTRDMNQEQRGMLAAELGLNEKEDVFEVEGLMGRSSLWQIANLDFPYLKDPVYTPIDHPRLKDNQKIFYKLRKDGPILLFHPFESFSTSVERFLEEASEDPKVRAIKMTLYRTSQKSKVIHYLLNAVRNGKQVTVVVELKARFDEAANIQWANQLEQAGIHITYGVVGLKTHCKVILVVRRDYNGLRRYAHISTGNYHAGTARLYTDFGLFTADDQIGADLTELFNYLSTGQTIRRNYKKLLVAPSEMKDKLLAKIQREIEVHQAHDNGLIRIKTNALQDKDIIAALYEASKAGVAVDLIVRDTCCLRPGIPELSDTIRVISIVGRFLEHTRVYYFHNGGDEEYFMGSADCMIRNLESRVEVLVPVEDDSLRREIAYILQTQLQDHRSVWEMHPDGSYTQRMPRSKEEEQGCHSQLIEVAQNRQKAAAQPKTLKSRGKSKLEYWHTYGEALPAEIKEGDPA